MALKLIGEDVEASSSRVVWQRDGEGREIAFFIRPVPASVDERISASVSRGLKGRQILDQSATRMGQQLVARTALRAAYALTGSERFDVETSSPKVVAALSKAIGREVKPDVPVLLDDCWNDDVKAEVFDLAPRIAAFISNKADELAGQDAEEEAALGKT